MTTPIWCLNFPSVICSNTTFITLLNVHRKAIILNICLYREATGNSSKQHTEGSFTDMLREQITSMQICYPSWSFKAGPFEDHITDCNQLLLIVLFLMPSSIITYSLWGIVDLCRLPNPSKLFFAFGYKEIANLEEAKLSSTKGF